ncbi:formylglycine-generating enzyme family protein [Oligosphaera ethanolica]|uniref:Formylglycine-generating enzyme required for sulfatase activity n=1 Tax=Oligosphaera ethanolica TaxID=760260 RepID=A0AAE3VK56_9BACT|nr:formylglycine-generating enzyme family protein [Oligosphaera ethanolica]MDQ0291905.1 formylglycine-generating enzyme required for sulfatase activity [Oligosphaera ethanolica]
MKRKFAELLMVLKSLLSRSNVKSELADRTAACRLDFGGGIMLDFVFVLPGKFLMGSKNNVYGGKPVHEVEITQPFYLGVTEVTQAQWEAVMGANPSYFKGATLPVENVSWEDCQVFIEKLNGKGLGTFRLPTEAEWEYSCRAGTTGDYTVKMDEMAWVRRNIGDTTSPVGTKEPNILGLHDMLGNVYEWCQDWYAPYNQDKQTDPKGAAVGSLRVVRGGWGGWGDTYLSSRMTYRCGNSPAGRDNLLGFRLVRERAEGTGVVVNSERAEGTGAVVNSERAEGTRPVVRLEFEQGTGAVSLDLGGGVILVLVLIRPGKFMMGSWRAIHGSPEHEVTISQPFYLGKYEVTQAQWQAVRGSNPSKFKGATLPVECVSWDDCQEFIEKLNGKGLGTFRLPTEAEWEYACRAGITDNYTRDLDEMAWHYNNSGKMTHPVGMKKANPWGLYDMLGNVMEWCQDSYVDYRQEMQIDPIGTWGFDCVLRGGCWFFSPIYCSAAFRAAAQPCSRSDFLGFRLVMMVQ